MKYLGLTSDDNDAVRYEHLKGLFTSLTNSSNQLSITVGTVNKKLTVAYASNAGTLDSHSASYFATLDALTTHTGNTSNPHSVTKSQVGLGNVENTALSTWAGTSNITTLGTITTGTWHGTAIANSYLANSSMTIAGETVSLGGVISAATIGSALTSSAPAAYATSAGKATNDSDGNAINSTYLKLSGGTLTGTLKFATGYGIEDKSGNGLLVYHPTTSWTGVSSTQWGCGAYDSQGVIRSSATDLIHYKNGTNCTIYDSGNCNSISTHWKCAILTCKYSSFVNSSSTEIGYVGNAWNNSEILFAGKSGYSLRFIANDSTAMYINTSGNVGIGVSSPTYKLHVDGTLYASGATTLGSSLTMNGALSGVTSIDSLLYFDTTNSYVGIGTTSPSAKLDVSGSMRLGELTPSDVNGTGSCCLDLIRRGATSSAYGVYMSFLAYNNTGWYVGGSGSKFAISSYFSSTRTERLSIDTSGNLVSGAGITAYASGTQAAGTIVDNIPVDSTLTKTNGVLGVSSALLARITALETAVANIQS